LENISRVSN